MTDRNEGEGNKTAARNYNRKTKEFVESADIEQEAREAEPESEREAAELLRAREKAASRARE